LFCNVGSWPNSALHEGLLWVVLCRSQWAGDVLHRSRLALTLAEREEISRAMVAGNSIRSIAMLLGRAASTISHEIEGCYRTNQADQAAWDRAHRPKVCKLVENRAVAQVVADKLQLQWSPEQIAGWLKRTYPDDTSYQVSHETIYRTLFIQARGALKKELLEHLRQTRAMRRSRHHTQKKENHGRITDAVPTPRLIAPCTHLVLYVFNISSEPSQFGGVFQSLFFFFPIITPVSVFFSS